MVALSIVLGGTAFAAGVKKPPKHSDAKADTALVKKIGRSLRVKSAKNATNAAHATRADSATAATNATHATSADTATNAASATSAAAATGLPGPLASGQTERGVYGLAGSKVNVGDYVADGAISFPIPLSTAPTFNFVNAGPTTQCPGSFADPTAAAGQLCLYPNFETGTGMSGDTTTRFGTAFFPTGIAAATNYEETGAWAVTAP